MFRSGTKYIYLFPAKGAGSLFKHFHIYARWPELARKRDLDVTMVGFLSIFDYCWRHSEVKERSREHVRIVPTPLGGKVKSACIVLYFVVLSLVYDRVVVHGRKVSVHTRLELARRIVGSDRIKYLIELEGDTVAEAEFAEGKDGTSMFYDDGSPGEAMEKQRRTVSRPDHVITVTEELRETLVGRYPELDLREKTTAITVDFPEHVAYSPDVREAVRSELGLSDRFVYAYMGSAAPVWQNVDRTIEIFSLLADQSDFDPFLLLLVREGDHQVVEESLNRVGVPEDDYLLTEVPSDEVKAQLYASDIGVMLRDDHPMCEVVYGHKYLEYLSAGLPVLTTEIAKWSGEIRENGYGIVLGDMTDDEEAISAFESFRKRDVDRAAIAQWAGEKFDPTRQVDRYVEILESLGVDGPGKT